MAESRTTFDYSLPPSFLALLSSPLPDVLNTLIPTKPQSQDVPSTQKQPDSAKINPSAPFLQAMRTIPDTVTEKGAAAHSDTNSPLVNLFYEMNPGIKAERLFELLTPAWKDDPVATLRIIFHTRSIHQGKGNEEVFFRALAWVWENHPRTMLENLHLIVDPTCKRDRSKQRVQEKELKESQREIEKRTEALWLTDVTSSEDSGVKKEEPHYPPRPHGCFKDLIDLLMLYINGQFTTAYTKKFSALNESLAPDSQVNYFREDRLQCKKDASKKRDRSGFVHVARFLDPSKRKRCNANDGQDSEEAELNKEAQDPFKAQLVKCPTRKAKHALFHSRVHTLMETDNNLKALYVVIVNIFTNAIKEDLVRLNAHKEYLKPHLLQESPFQFGMSYAAKWVPSPAKGADRQLHFSTAIAHALFPDESRVELQREKLQREVLSPLRRATNVPETKMGEGLWNIDYTKVPARAMSRNASNYSAHDPEGFEKYLTKVAEGRYTISGASMLPHELVIDSQQQSDAMVSRLANLQWKSLVDSISSSSDTQLSDCMAIADVSGSMGRFSSQDSKKTPKPISVCIALTLLLGELAKPPWNGSFFTFSSEPTLEFIDPSLDLSRRAANLNNAHWEMSTNFDKVFDLILETAKRQKLKPENMVKKLFVFSDMQFDQASDHKHGETEHATIKRKFEEAGYPMPEMVYWNLAFSGEGGKQLTSKPVQADVEGVSLVSGFSGALMKYFLGLGGEGANEEIADEEGEEEGDEIDDDGWGAWEKVSEGDQGAKAKSTGDAPERKKRKTNPLATVQKIIGAESFRDVKVVD